MDSAIKVASDRRVQMHSGTAEVSFPTFPKYSLFEQDLLNSLAIELNYSFIDIIVRLVQCVTARYRAAN